MSDGILLASLCAGACVFAFVAWWFDRRRNDSYKRWLERRNRG